MIISKELNLRIQHLKINLFSFRLQYLKALINICSLIGRLKNKFPY
jgi:hypothetical protein